MVGCGAGSAHPSCEVGASVTSFASCPSCGAPRRPGASPAGLCPACLLSNALQDDLTAEAPEEDAGTLLLPGVMLGTFRIGALLGRGGMATVYEAYDTPLERTVALKILPPQFLHDRSFARRFEQEARVVARLEHPAIVPIYASGTDDGIPWMSMRLLSGGNMGTLLKHARPDRARAVEILRQVAEALDYAHANGVVHRDIKPTNILFDGSNRPCVSDFGLAQMLEGNPVVTRTGMVVGTPVYMAPEQALGKGVNHRCDVYSLGIVAYEMFVGAPPFTDESPVAVLLKHVNEPLPVPPASRLSEPMLRAIQKAVAKDPSDRWSSAGAFTDALAAALADQHSERRTVWLTLAGAALLGTAALAWLIVTPPSEGPASPAPVVFSVPPPDVPPTVPPENGGQQANTDDRKTVRTGPVAPTEPGDSGQGRGTSTREPEKAPARTDEGPAPPPKDRPGDQDDKRPESPTEPPLKPPSAPPDSNVRTPPAADVIVFPRLIQRVTPTYPDVARTARLEGDVVLEVTVEADGTVANVMVLKSPHPVLDDAARKAVMQYRYSPGRRNDVPAAMRVQATVIFQMR